MKLPILALSVPLGIMLSPESLVRLGNLAGGGSFSHLLLALAALVAALGAGLILHPGLSSRGEGATLLLSRELGSVPAATLLLSSRISVTLLAATAVLVTAGYAFNEIFLYWFPNFGFAFLLLFLVLAANLAGERWALRLQVLAALLALSCLCILLFLGVLAEGAPLEAQSPINPSPHLALGAVLLFLGYDLVSPAENGPSRGAVLVLLGLVLLLFSCWAGISAHFVAWSSLADSTIPHILAAKRMLGQPGRYLIGTVVICGAVAMVNGLFIATTRTWLALSAQQLVPRFFQGRNQGRFYCLLSALVIGVLMMSGLAGEEELELYLRGALLLWLLKLGAHSLAASRHLRGSHAGVFASGMVVSCLFFGIVFGLLFTDPNRVQLTGFILLTLAGTAGFSWSWQQVVKRYL
ncbi:hypothetical protein [Desulfogranum mediterraneum]|uniref:hypothetical protein n=1 Tax=Desulfogranum mediterraneum TaxID=160661 RepID=UPI000420A44F|nr:hypothetical protein [Desulfogranum mediterraneum]